MIVLPERRHLRRALAERKELNVVAMSENTLEVESNHGFASVLLVLVCFVDYI